jgi:hypothetical protein
MKYAIGTLAVIVATLFGFIVASCGVGHGA